MAVRPNAGRLVALPDRLAHLCYYEVNFLMRGVGSNSLPSLPSSVSGGAYRTIAPHIPTSEGLHGAPEACCPKQHEKQLTTRTNDADLAASRPVICTVRHSDDTTETLSLNHSFSTSQIDWFKAGSALNLLSR